MNEAHRWVDPTILRVEWLEEAMLVHAITMDSEPRSPWVHGLFAGALATGLAGALALVWGLPSLAGVLAVVWVGCVGGLGSIAWRIAHAVPPTKRRLLIELKPETVSWTLLEGNRWGMQYQHQIPMPTMSRASGVETPLGAEVDLALTDGSHRRIPLHGLPATDAVWLAERICEGIEAAAEVALT